MNYKIITDLSKLEEFINWLPELKSNEKYYFNLLARKKYTNASDILSDKSQLKRFVSNKDRIIEKIRQLEVALGSWKINGIEAPQDSLALYISINPRCMKKATELMGKSCWDLMNKENYNIHAEAFNCIQKSKSRTCFMDFDIDDKSVEFDEEWLGEELGKENYSIIETRGGFHLLVDSKKASSFRVENNKDMDWYKLIKQKYVVDQSGDQLLPVIGTYQGGFIPKFIKKGKKN